MQLLFFLKHFNSPLNSKGSSQVWPTASQQWGLGKSIPYCLQVVKCIGGLLQVQLQEFLVERVIFTDFYFIFKLFFLTFRVLFLWFPTSLWVQLEIRMSFWLISLHHCFQNMKFPFIVLESEHPGTALLDQTEPPGCGRFGRWFHSGCCTVLHCWKLSSEFYCAGNAALRVISEVAHPHSAPRTEGGDINCEIAGNSGTCERFLSVQGSCPGVRMMSLDACADREYS